MPIYEYQCQSCDEKFEAIVHGSQKPECPNCGGVKLKKQFSTFAVNAPQPVAFGGGCSTCGDPRGPGACALD